MVKPAGDQFCRICKRGIDIAVSGLLLLCLSPLLIVTAIIVRLTLGPPILFRHQRPGYREKIFTLYKFRTMTNDRDANGDYYPDAKRLTKFGKFIRSVSIDELPQLWNVVKGEMSLVGPRPLLIEYLPLYNAEQHRRHDVPPGLVGWAAVNGRNALTWEKKFELDLWYVDNWSLLLDLRIILKATWVVLKREGIGAGEGLAGIKFAGNKRSTTN